MKLVVIGGGAAGFFGAIAAAQHLPAGSVLLIEKTRQLLSKVKISGGGRCNVTHACFDPATLTQNYPRGHRELLGPFNRFQPLDTIQWFESRGVPLKIEQDGRVFPVSNQSQSIMDCLLQEALKTGVEIRLGQKLEAIKKGAEGFTLVFPDSQLDVQTLLLATGGLPQGLALAAALGHHIVPPVPSLFTFNVPDFSLKELAGVSVADVKISIAQAQQVFSQRGPLLVTHWGFSGPAALKLSAWGARALHALNYQAVVTIDWVPHFQPETCLIQQKKTSPHLMLGKENPFELPKQLWKTFLAQLNLDPQVRYADISHKDLQLLSQKLRQDAYTMDGKIAHKEEFVTCGGVHLKEVNFKTMESKITPGLYFAGEILDIDGVTGGFNFQNAWTTGWIAGHAAAETLIAS